MNRQNGNAVGQHLGSKVPLMSGYEHKSSNVQEYCHYSLLGLGVCVCEPIGKTFQALAGGHSKIKTAEDTSSGKGDADPVRAAVCERLRGMPFLAPSDPQFMFGRGYAGPLKSPKVLWKSDKPPRKDHSCPKWLTATEFEDVPEAGLAAKPPESKRESLSLGWVKDWGSVWFSFNVYDITINSFPVINSVFKLISTVTVINIFFYHSLICYSDIYIYI